MELMSKERIQHSPKEKIKKKYPGEATAVEMFVALEPAQIDGV